MEDKDMKCFNDLKDAVEMLLDLITIIILKIQLIVMRQLIINQILKLREFSMTRKRDMDHLK